MTNTMTTRMKAAAVAALMCLSVTTTTAIAMTESIGAEAAAVKVGESIKVGGAYKGYIADLGAKDIKTLTFTLTAAKKCSFSYGFGIGTAEKPYWLEYDGTNDEWVDTDGGKVDVEGTSVAAKDATFTVTIDVSDLELDYSKSGKFEFRNYYCADWSTGKENDLGKITLVSVEANAGEEDTTDPTDPEDPAEEGAELGEKDVFTGYWADYAKKGINNVAISFTADFTGTVNFGMGIGVADKPYWYEYDAKTKKWVDTSDKTAKVDGFSAEVEEGKTYVMVYDTSKYDLSYTPKTEKYPGHFEFRNNSVSEKGGTITVTKVEVNTTKKSTVVEASGSSGTGDHELAKTDGTHSANRVSGQFKFTDNKDGTGTMIATQARQIDFETPYLLTRGYDEEYYLNEDIEWEEGVDPINSHKFAYRDFGLSGVGSNVTIESLTATITSERDVKNFMYGGGLNVDKDSPADTEAAKAAAGLTASKNAGYWYNDMGEDKVAEYEEAGVEFGIEPCYGYYLTAGKDTLLGSYFNVVWDVPEEVMPYEKDGEISFQYWYGVDTTEDAEDYADTEIDEVELIGGMLTYTEEKTFDYTDTLSYKVGTKIEAGDMSGEISFADAGAADGDVQAVVFNLTTTADLNKLVYAVGASVGEKDFKMFSDAEGGDTWNYVITDQKKGKVQIAWIVPKGYDINEAYGNIQLGYWYGGTEGGDELDEITLDSVDIYYSAKEEATEPPTDPVTDPPLKVTMYGDVDCDGEVGILDVVVLNKSFMVGTKISQQGKLNADVDTNGTVNETDSLNILKSILGMETLPIK